MNIIDDKLTPLQEAVRAFSKSEEEKAGVPQIKNAYKGHVVNQLIENTLVNQAGEGFTHTRLNDRFGQMINEAAGTGTPSINMTAGVKNYDPVLVKMVRRAVPQLMAFDLCGVQPLSQPTGLIFALRARYDTQTGAEALFDEARTNYSGAKTGSHAGDSSGFNKDFIKTGTPKEDSKTGTGLLLSDAEVLGTTAGQAWAEMGLSIERTDVAAKSRKLKATYTRELAQDMASVHGLSVEDELINVLSQQLVSEIDREIIRTINHSAVLGAKNTNRAGIFDMAADSDGRFFAERVKHLLFFIETEANMIAKRTRAGRANRIICSSNVASALKILGLLEQNPAITGGLAVDETKQTFAGVLMNQYQVWIDPYTEVDYITLGYKGESSWDAGIYYCPYIPVERYSSVGTDDFNQKIGLSTRYGLVANPYFSTKADGTQPTGKGLGQGENGYFAKFAIANLSYTSK